MKIFLDDLRRCPAGWMAARWPEDVIRAIEAGPVEAISLDRDLGDPTDARTGEVVLRYLAERLHADPAFLPPLVTIHTDNAAHRVPMQQDAQRLNLERARRVTLQRGVVNGRMRSGGSRAAFGCSLAGTLYAGTVSWDKSGDADRFGSVGVGVDLKLSDRMGG